MIKKGIELKMFVDTTQDAAILFHDVIYNVGSHTNEIDSAEYAISMLSKYKPHNMRQNQIDIIALCILSTINHVPLCEDAKEIIDLDFVSLAFEDDYNINKKLIREEYNVTDKQWKIGRKNFLETILSKKNIFYTIQCQPLEEKARQNIKNELSELS